MADEQTVTLSVPQQDGTIATFDGVHRAWNVVKGEVEVAVSDLEHFLRNVPGASVPNSESATSSDSKDANPASPAPITGANPAPKE